jgi:hypothetical protein
MLRKAKSHRVLRFITLRDYYFWKEYRELSCQIAPAISEKYCAGLLVVIIVQAALRRVSVREIMPSFR